MERRNKEDLQRRSLDDAEGLARRKQLGERADLKAAQKFKAEHTVAAGETLSQIALKYYGSAVKAKWMKIYEANKDLIGDNPNLLQPGQVLKVPELGE